MSHLQTVQIARYYERVTSTRSKKQWIGLCLFGCLLLSSYSAFFHNLDAAIPLAARATFFSLSCVACLVYPILRVIPLLVDTEMTIAAIRNIGVGDWKLLQFVLLERRFRSQTVICQPSVVYAASALCIRLGHADIGEKLRVLAVRQMPWLATVDLLSARSIPGAQLEMLISSLLASMGHTVAGRILKHRNWQVWCRAIVRLTMFSLGTLALIEHIQRAQELPPWSYKQSVWLFICIAVIISVAWLINLSIKKCIQNKAP